MILTAPYRHSTGRNNKNNRNIEKCCQHYGLKMGNNQDFYIYLYFNDWFTKIKQNQPNTLQGAKLHHACLL